MIASKQNQIAKEIEVGTGASISVSLNQTGRRASLRIWFSDLLESGGPVVELRPDGLRGYKIVLSFGRSAGLIINQIRAASSEALELARALVKSIDKDVELLINNQKDSNWTINDGSFNMVAIARQKTDQDNESTVFHICREVIVPMFAAMAELIGYDDISEIPTEFALIFEGAISIKEIKRRERNPRNRLLCIRINGNKCHVCGIDPQNIYGIAGMIIEVHHLQPLSCINGPRAYNPETDLIPLCPNCHRAIHTRRPIPWNVNEIKSLMGGTHGAFA